VLQSGKILGGQRGLHPAVPSRIHDPAPDGDLKLLREVPPQPVRVHDDGHQPHLFHPAPPGEVERHRVRPPRAGQDRKRGQNEQLPTNVTLHILIIIDLLLHPQTFIYFVSYPS
jgi:hypothetical protein